jgi:hypothetical protein
LSALKLLQFAAKAAALKNVFEICSFPSRDFLGKHIIKCVYVKKNAVRKGANLKNTPVCCRGSGNVYSSKANWRVAGEPAFAA